MVTAFICIAAIVGVFLAFVWDLRNIRKIERLQTALDEATERINLLTSENGWLSTERNELVCDNSKMKKTATKLFMQIAESFGQEVTNPKREKHQ